MAHLTVRLFGYPHFLLDNVPIKVERRKTIALAAYLAVETASYRGAPSQPSPSTIRSAPVDLSAPLPTGCGRETLPRCSGPTAPRTRPALTCANRCGISAKPWATSGSSNPTSSSTSTRKPIIGWTLPLSMICTASGKPIPSRIAKPSPCSPGSASSTAVISWPVFPCATALPSTIGRRCRPKRAACTSLRRSKP